MPQLRLLNRSGKSVNTGDLVKAHESYTNSFVSAKLGDDGIIGTAAQRISSSSWGLINQINTVLWADIIGKPNKVTVDYNAPVNPSIGDSWIQPSQT
jgi:hypothetical protein